MSAFASFARPFVFARSTPRPILRDDKPSLFATATALAAAADAGRPLPTNALRELLDR